jgi:hypothetical protein
MIRTGVNRRQVPQLKKQLSDGVSVTAIASNFNVYPEVVLNFAKGWKIRVEDTPESIELEKHNSLIEHEVLKRMNARDKAAELKAVAKANRKALEEKKESDALATGDKGLTKK